MPPLTLEGNTLGEKHKNFNKIVQNAIDNKEIHLSEINSNDIDIENLLKIDVAGRTKNFEYITEVLKCNDMLYVSRAIRQSMWLITEKDYTHIINPEYLYTELFPYMLTKAVNKLLLHIRLHLKDEKRIESFFTYMKNIGNDCDANKWLPNCSIPFIEAIIQDEKQISLKLYKRLCKRSVKFVKFYAQVAHWSPISHVLFLLKSNTEEFLNILEVMSLQHPLPSLSKKCTEILMKKRPNRIIDNYEIYISAINTSVLVKYLKKEDIKDFLFKYMKNNKTKKYFCDFEMLKHFINKIPEKDKFEFVKKTYIDRKKATLAMSSCEDDTANALPTCNVNIYRWYQFAPFDVAFVEIKKLICAEHSPAERCAMLSVLIICARKNLQTINPLLQHFYDKHRNEPFKFKVQFVNSVIAQLPTHDFDSENWKILDTLFHTLEVYIESDNELQSCLQAIILYKVLHDEHVPDIVARKFQFITFKKTRTRLTEQQRNKLFAYLINLITTRINIITISTESDLENVISLIENALRLINDWNKNLDNYTYIRNKIRELIKRKQENGWKTNFSSLYNSNKSFRRFMFQESIILHPTEEVCLNAFKYDPVLLTRYSDVIDRLRADDTVSLGRLLAKLRLYWPRSLAQEWANKYLKQMDMSTGHKAAIRGLFTLLPQNQIIDITKKYVPAESKIYWNEIDQMKLSLQKNIAKYLYQARPLIGLDVVLWYAKGDYLQFAVPSLNAISHNVSKKRSVAYITSLLNAPVSLQKYGLHLANMKLKYDELKPLFSNVWKSTMNVTIRTRIFTYIYNNLCQVKEPFDAVELWALMSEFIENMATDENKLIFSKLGRPENIHACVRGQFYTKSYKYLTSLPPAANCATYVNKLLAYAPNIIDILDDDFVSDTLLSPLKEIISKPRSGCIEIMSSYVLFGKTEEEQSNRFRTVIVPALENAFLLWNTETNGQYVCKVNVDVFLRALIWDLRKLLYFKKVIVPVNLFTEIKILLEQNIPQENYLLLTSWTLTCEYVKLLAENYDMFPDANFNIASSWAFTDWLPQEAEQVWETVHMKISPAMGLIIVNLLKEDSKKYFSTICWLFSETLEIFFNNFTFPKQLLKMETLKYMLVNEDYIPSYVVVCNLLPTSRDDEVTKKRTEIREILAAHPSLEVQMHYHKV